MSHHAAFPGPPAAGRRALGALAQADMFVFGIVMALIGAVVPSLSGRLSITLADVGTLFLVMNGGMLAASLLLGLVMDRFGLKLPLAVGAWLVAAGLALVAGADRYGLLLPAVTCLGLGGGALNGGANTLVSDLHDDATRKGAALNLLGVFFGFGALLLPFGLGALTSAFGWAGLLWFAAGLCALIGLAAAALPFPGAKQVHGFPLANMSRFVRMPAVLLVGLLLFFQSGNEFALGGYLATAFTREAGLSINAASYGLAAYWASIITARMLLSRMLPVLGAPTVVTGSALLSAVGAVIVAAAATPAVAVAGAVLTGFALAGIFPTVLGLAGARFEEHSGTVFGLLFTLALCGGMTIPWLAGHLAEAQGVRAVFVLVAANFAAVAVVSVVASRMLAARS